MPGPSRTPQRGGPSDRRAGAQRPRRTRRHVQKRQLARRVSWSRRIGAAAALLLLAGGSIAFAGQSLDRGRAADAANVAAPVPPPPTLLAPHANVTRVDHIDVTALQPRNLRRDQRYSVRIYVNGERVRELALPAQSQFTIQTVPLVEGDNLIRASLVGTSGEGAQSAPIAMALDDVAPGIKILGPTTTVYAGSATLLGKTEPRADIDVKDGDGHDLRATVQSDGRFSAGLSLAIGDNVLTLRSTDIAGNTTTTRAIVVRAASAAGLDLTVSPPEIFSAQLPASVDMTVSVRDELGRPVNNAKVTFGVSPPLRETMTYQVSMTNGRARFSDLTLESGDASGEWLVTALVVLPSGTELRADGSFSLVDGAPKSPGQH